MHTTMTTTKRIQSKNTLAIFAGVALAATLLASSPLKADDARLASSQAADDVDYNAPGVSYRQFGKAAKTLAEGQLSAETPCPRWVFTRAFAWAAYEYTYNRPNYDRWLAQLTDRRLQDVMVSEVQAYVAAGRPPIANPMAAADDAGSSWTAYRAAPAAL